MPAEQLQEAVLALREARKTVALTGAGISVESGIPPFRGPGGLWEKYDPMKYAHIEAFERNPAEVWQVLFMGMKKQLEKAQPNNAHRGLYRLQQMGKLKTVITQNIDGLHQRAGNNDVIEFHGSFAKHRCMVCRRDIALQDLAFDKLPPHCACGGVVRPDVVMFGEAIPFYVLQRSRELAATCDAMLVIGTSATVEPAAHLPLIAKRSGAKIIEVNAEQTPLSRHISDITLLGRAANIMKQLADALETAATV
jgi:NAD-dependent deacetylase